MIIILGVWVAIVCLFAFTVVWRSRDYYEWDTFIRVWAIVAIAAIAALALTVLWLVANK